MGVWLSNLEAGEDIGHESRNVFVMAIMLFLCLRRRTRNKGCLKVCTDPLNAVLECCTSVLDVTPRDVAISTRYGITSFFITLGKAEESSRVDLKFNYGRR